MADDNIDSPEPAKHPPAHERGGRTMLIIMVIFILLLGLLIASPMWLRG